MVDVNVGKVVGIVLNVMLCVVLGVLSVVETGVVVCVLNVRGG